MNKRQLLDRVSTAFEVNKTSANEILSTFIGIIEDSILSGEEINITGFGKFSLSKRKAKNGVNPRTKEPISIPGYTTITFKSSTVLKNTIKSKFDK